MNDQTATTALPIDENAPEARTSRARLALAWGGQLVAAVIMGQTLFFKFSGAPEARALFETLGVEPWGRIATGVFELVAVVLLLVPRSAAFGGLLTIGLMLGAIASHLTLLGIEVEGDGGALFAMAVLTLCAGLLVSWTRRASLPFTGGR